MDRARDDARLPARLAAARIDDEGAGRRLALGGRGVDPIQPRPGRSLRQFVDGLVCHDSTSPYGIRFCRARPIRLPMPASGLRDVGCPVSFRTHGVVSAESPIAGSAPETPGLGWRPLGLLAQPGFGARDWS